jgi:hypothetical protein
MDTIAFIRNDVEKDAQISGWRLAVFGLGTAAIPAALGLFLREDWRGVFELERLVPNILAAVLLGLFPVLYRRRIAGGVRAYPKMAIFLALAVLFAAARLAFPGGDHTQYDSSAAFWSATRVCFGKGAIAAAVTGLWLGLLTLYSFSLPSARWRKLIAAAGGTAAAVMLGFHCDSSSVPHVLLGHILPGAVTGFAIYAVLTVAFHRRVGAVRKI